MNVRPKRRTPRTFVVVALVQTTLSAVLIADLALSAGGAPDRQRSNQTASQQQKEHEEVNDTLVAYSAAIQAVAALASLGLTGFLVWYSDRGWKAARANARAATRSARAAESAILMANRPKIIVREIDVPEAVFIHRIATTAHEYQVQAIVADVARRLDSFDNRDVLMTGSFRVTNKGNAPATTQLIEAAFWVGQPLPQMNPVFGHHIDRQLAMAGGTTERIDLKPMVLTDSDRSAIWDQRSGLYVLGKIVYTDKLGNARRTGFARRLNVKTGRFEETKGEPDYEYVD